MITGHSIFLDEILGVASRLLLWSLRIHGRPRWLGQRQALAVVREISSYCSWGHDNKAVRPIRLVLGLRCKYMYWVSWSIVELIGSMRTTTICVSVMKIFLEKISLI